MQYLRRLEKVRNAVFPRSRWFGKFVLCSIQRYYYDLDYAACFDELFDHTWIGQNRTGNQSWFIICFLNFSGVEADKTVEEIKIHLKAITILCCAGWVNGTPRCWARCRK